MVDKIRELLIYPNGKFIPSRINKSFLEKHNLYSFINNSYNNTYSLLEKIYCLTNGLKERPKCKTCNCELKFNHKYATFCSASCINKDPDILRKNSENVSKSLKKAYQIKGDEIKTKRNLTLKKQYGKEVTSPFSINEVQQKCKETLLRRYGIDNAFNLEKSRSKVKKIVQDLSIKFNKQNGFNIEYLGKNKILVKNLCNIHGDVEFNCTSFYNRAHKNRNGIICILCNPLHNYSSLEKEIDSFIKNDLNITNYYKNTKNIIPPLELDFYFPDYKLAIELNGLYWHSEIHKDKNYHKIKSDLCEEKGIQLIHIWEDNFYNKTNIVKSILKSKFNIYENIINADNCNIKKLNLKTYAQFISINHIDELKQTQIRYGLFYKQQLVSVIGFNKLNNDYELTCLCHKLNHNIINGYSKLINYFKNKFNCNNIIYYSKRDLPINYNELKIKTKSYCEPNFYEIINDKRKESIKTNNIGCYDSGSVKILLNV